MSIKDWDLHTEKMDAEDKVHAANNITSPANQMRELWDGSQLIGYVNPEFIPDIKEAVESNDDA